MTYSSDLAAADAASLSTARDTITALMDDKYPGKGWAAGGILEAAVVEPLATGLATVSNESEAIKEANSLSTAATAGDTATVDRLLTNYFTTRTPATPSSGSVVVVTTTETVLSIQETVILTVDGIEFSPVLSYRVYPSESGRNDPANGIISFTKRSDGNFSFVITLQSLETGAKTRIVRGAEFDATLGVPGLVSISAVSDFTGGTDEQTVESAVEAAKQGVTPATVSSYDGIKKLVAELFPGSTAGVIGAGHAAMVRDRDAIFGFSVGGKADTYVKTLATDSVQTVEVAATLFPVDREARVWQFDYTIAGAYKVIAIRPADVTAIGGYTPQSETITAVPPTSGFVPKISDTDAVFTAHQLRTVRFAATDLDYTAIIGATPVNEAITKTFVVDILAMPLVSEIDVALRNFSSRDPGLDVLVRAAVPCLVDVAVTVRGTVDVNAATAAIAAAIGALPVGTDTIPANLVYDTLRPLVAGTIGTVSFRAEVIGFDLKSRFTNAKGELTIPAVYANGVCAESLAFLTSPDRITVEVA